MIKFRYRFGMADFVDPHRCDIKIIGMTISNGLKPIKARELKLIC